MDSVWAMYEYGKCTITFYHIPTIDTVNSVSAKTVNTALVQDSEAAYLCSQKLIDVQQTLIMNPNPLKISPDNYRDPLIPEKPTIKSDISQLLF